MIARISLALCLCLTLLGTALAGELEVGKEQDGTITLKQKREPKPAAPPNLETGKAEPSGPGEIKTPDAKKKEQGKAPSEADNETRRAAIQELNTLITNYNERVESLQAESDKKYKEYQRDMQRLKERKESIEAAMNRIPSNMDPHSPEAARWVELANQRNELFATQERLNSEWSKTSASLEKRIKTADEAYAAERAKILKKYNLKESDIQ